MTFAHILIGLILGKKFGYTLAFIIGSVVPDADHLFVLLKHKHFRLKEIFEVMKYEDKYGERYKTPYTHSLLSWLIFLVIGMGFDLTVGIAFSIAYLLHLLLDLLDKDEMQIFYPFKYKIRGFLPIFSYWEIVFGVILLFAYVLA